MTAPTVALGERVDQAAVIYQHGACQDMPTSVFFPAPPRNEWGRAGKPADHDPYVQARRVCGGCPVKDQCAEFALDGNETAGMWGGLDPDQRAAIRKQRQEAAS